MSGTFSVGRLFGVNIRVHFSWVFIFALIAWSLASSWLPGRYPGWSGGQYWVVGIVGSAMLFVCVLIHEMSHSLEAIRRGLSVRSITLFFLGGFSQIDGESRTASEEFWVSVVGPIASLALASIFGLLYLNFRSSPGQIAALLQYLMIVNFVVGVFNLIPAFPLDGGRVLRALVWRATRSEQRATRVTSLTGSVLGFGLIAVGIFFVFTNDLITGIWLVFIGWFIQSTASSARQSSAERRIATGRTVREAMDEGFHAVTPGTSVQSLLEDHAAKDFQRAYLVMLGDTLHGIVTLTDAGRAPVSQRSEKWVSEVMTRAPDLVTLSPEDPLEEGLRLLAQRNIRQLVVMESEKPVGMLTRAGVVRVMEVAQLLPTTERSE